jgi:hypothetical protein
VTREDRSRTTRLVRTCLLVVSVLSVASTASPDVVTDWNSLALDTIREANTPPPIASRTLAILHASMYDAVNGISRECEPYFVRGPVPASASPVAAASAAAHDVLTTLFPSASATFDLRHRTTLAQIADGPSKNKGIEWGESVAAQILLSRQGDNSTAIVPPPPGSEPGAWVPTPPAFAPYLLPQWGFVAPFAMPTSSFFRPLGPPSLASIRYAKDVNEVKSFGSATGSVRSDDQTTIALFWADGTGTETPPGHWNSIAATVALSRGNTLLQNARLFALLNIAMADAAICAWDAKYTYDFWRPITAIRNADADGNDLTTPDPLWEPLIATPPFPEYVSGHSTFSAAAAVVLARFYGTDDIQFTATSDVMPAPRAFPSFSAAANEAAASRLYGGIHFRSAIEDGLTSGTEIGEWVFAHLLQQGGNRSR